MSNINEVVESRDSIYGGFDNVSAVSQALQEILFAARPKSAMLSYQAEAIQVICSKLARATCGDPMYVDNWLDIAGYATLVVRYLDFNNVAKK